ncbi:MAG: outer membrane beta-barrel protein [Candidatus Zixiibacteriota bacterium]|nr:MAG: outer membrane beta-barrel protein [candidate division Zixibacteria bacterium]
MKKLMLTLFILMLAVPSFALTGISIGIKGGVASYSDDIMTAPGYDADGLKLIGGQVKISSLPVINLLVSGEYMWKSETLGFGTDQLELNQHDFALSATALYPIKFKVISPFAGAGISNHNLGFDYTAPLSLSLEDNGVYVPDSENRLGYHLIGGFDVNVPAFPVMFSAEYRQNWIDTDNESVKYYSISLGANFKLP